MSARVHAIVVVRPDGRVPASAHLKRTLEALRAQTHPVDALTIVRCGDDPVLIDRVADAGADSVIALPLKTSYETAVRAGADGADADAHLWLLAQDTAPEPDALARLVGHLESSATVALVAPKLVRGDDRSMIVSLGETLTRAGRAVVLAEDELDQGQHDGTDDVLGVDIRAILVRGARWRALGGIDPGLRGADEGLDLGVRARLAGERVSVVPQAFVAVDGDGVAGMPIPRDGRRARRRTFARRTAQLHRRLVYAPLAAVALHWLSLLPLAVARTAQQLIAKTPAAIAPEWAAAVVAMVQIPAVWRARRSIARARTTSWATLAPLRATRADLQSRLGALEDEPQGPDRSDLRFFSGGGAWVVLAALIVSVVAFTALLAWPAISGGALLPMRDSFAQLWADAAYGPRASGLDAVGPADPFAAVIALLGTLWFLHPPATILVLWVGAMPLAALAGWFAATRVTERASLRLAGATVWALAPSLLTALVDPRPAAVLAHLLLPWLFYVGSVAHRSWGAAGAASLLLVAVIACAPSLAPAFAVIWLLALILVTVARHGRGVARVIWAAVPTAGVFAPLIWHQTAHDDVWALLADPGAVWAGSQAAADAAGRLVLALGFPSPDLAGWQTLLDGAPSWWVPILLAPIAVLALLAPLSGRRVAGTALLAVAVLGVGTAFVQAGVAVAFADAVAAPVWAGTGLSLALAGATGAALTTLDTGIAARPALLRPLAVTAVIAGMLAVAVPSVTAMARGDAQLTLGPRSTLPAYVAAIGRDDPDVGTLVLTPLNEGGVSSDVVWGATEAIGSPATMLTTRTESTADDQRIARITVDLIASSGPETVESLRAAGLSFVLLSAQTDQPTARAEAMLLRAGSAIDQREGLVPVGETDRGTLWRLDAEPAPRGEPTAAEATAARAWMALQIGVVGIALLLAVPTSRSRRAARHRSRVVGIPRREARS